MDHRCWSWPNVPHGSLSQIFERSQDGKSNWSILKADYFGFHQPRGKYGNGSISVATEDLKPFHSLRRD